VETSASDLAESAAAETTGGVRFPPPWIEAAAGLLFPDLCQLCRERRATRGEGYVCAACWKREGGVRFIRPPFCERCGLPFAGEITAAFECSNCRDLDLAFSHARSAVVATPALLRVIHGYKYDGNLFYEPFLADLFRREAAPELAKERWDALVPVPLHPTRQREREFNQAERLARQLALACAIPVEAGLVCRTRFTDTQTRLSREKRATNMRRAFALVGKPDLRGKRFVVIDDVLTTGATTSACAAVLKKAGAAEVMVWTLARGI
jgi:competence protein ComFC